AAQDRGVGAHEFEMRVVIERPADRHLDEVRLASQYRRALQLDHVAQPRAIGQIVVTHHAALVEKAVLQKKLDGMWREIPGRRAVAARLPAGELADRLVRARQAGLFLLARKAGRR